MTSPTRHAAVVTALATAVSMTTLSPLPCAASDTRATEPAFPRQDRTQAVAGARFVGSEACRSCHQLQFNAWSGSDHDRAMAHATAKTVLGDFSDARFRHFDVESRMFRRDGRFFVNTDGPDGELADFEVLYTFGVDPLQQYLVALPGGRLQALPLAWDTRPDTSGGQRWFHLYPDESFEPSDLLHWTGIAQNWNYVCADCHSTNLRRRYDDETRSYETTWADIDVGCEACHGAGSEHVAWANDPSRGEKEDTPNGLRVDLAAEPQRWRFAPGQSIARLDPPRRDATPETCAPCHARRSPLRDGYTVGRPLEDAYRLALLREPLYHADGQIRDEVYVYGSFLQSRMYAAGVSCGDCHDPHTLALRAPGNALCATCHLATVYDTTSHHFHAAEKPGGSCVDCHAPATTYMVIDDRRDHSFRIPRPDLSTKFGTPNACNGCHTDKDNSWAADAITHNLKTHGKKWEPDARQGFAARLALAGARGPRTEDVLLELSADSSAPAIARATALSMLALTPSPRSLTAVSTASNDRSALVRREAAAALAFLPADVRVQTGSSLLADPVLSVRLAAAEAFVDIDDDALPEGQRSDLEDALAEYVASQRTLADRPESLVNLGNFYTRRGETRRAEKYYRRAIAEHPAFLGAYVNLADLYRAEGDERKVRDILQTAIQRIPDEPDALHSVGLSYVRDKRYEDAATPLAAAARLAPDNLRYGFVYALCLERIGRLDAALQALEAVRSRHPHDPQVLLTLATMNRDNGDRAAALAHARTLAEIAPDDPSVRALLEQLESSP